VRKSARFIALLILAAGCATTKTVDMEEPRRVVATENDVRIDAQIFGDRLMSSTTIPLKYDITNERQQAIAIADMVPEVSYDAETQTVTLGIGSEVPGSQLLPRLIAIAPGEKKSFSTVARVNLVVGTIGTPTSRFPNALRLKVNFLSDTTEFAPLISMTQKGLQDPALMDRLFPIWLEKNETLYTNSVPMRWSVEPSADVPAARRRRG
jgi:hypothetical protein